jgi:hypothetical protein
VPGSHSDDPEAPRAALAAAGRIDVELGPQGQASVRWSPQFDLEFVYKHDDQGRMALISFKVSGAGGVTSTLLRELPLSQIAAEIDARVRQAQLTEEMLEAMERQRPSPSRARRSDKEGLLQEVARLYRETLRAGQPPAPTIAAIFNQTGPPVSIRTVHGWIAQARKRGHLPPATKGRAG